MAIFRPSSIIAAISGNLGGVNFTQSKAGPVIRKRIYLPKQTDKRHAWLRARMQAVRLKWQTLDPELQTAWRQAALIFPNRNRLGVATRISGYQLFVRMNTYGWPDTGIDATAFHTIPPDLTATVAFPTSDFSVIAGGTKTITVQAPDSEFLLAIVCYGARTLSTKQKTTWHNFRYLNGYPAAPAVGPNIIDLTTEWDERIGDPIAGEQCWIQYHYKFLFKYPSPSARVSTITT